MAVLRRLEHGDLDEVVALQREGAVAALGHMFPQQEHPFPTAEIRARWAAELDDSLVHSFAIILDRRLAGFAATRQDEFLHFGTAVPTWGTGLAGMAHDEVLDVLRGQGHRTAWLRVFDDNARAIRFYRRRGWRPTDSVTRTTFPPFPVLRRFELDL